MKPTRAGLLRDRIIIEQPTRTPDPEFGEPIPSWTTFAETWASVEPLRGTELTQAAQVQGNHTHRVTIRFREGLRNDMRIRFGERVLNIVSIGDIESRSRRVEILCREPK
jgi:SPP1 family predicted phage head-tail adaptor